MVLIRHSPQFWNLHSSDSSGAFFKCHKFAWLWSHSFVWSTKITSMLIFSYFLKDIIIWLTITMYFLTIMYKPRSTVRLEIMLISHMPKKWISFVLSVMIPQNKNRLQLIHCHIRLKLNVFVIILPWWKVVFATSNIISQMLSLALTIQPLRLWIVQI